MPSNVVEIVFQGIDEVSDKVRGIADGMGPLTGLATVGGGVAGALLGIGAAAAVGLGLAASEAAGAEEAEQRLAAVLQSTKGVAGMTQEELVNLASALQGVTRYSDDAVMSGEAILLTFTGIGKDVFPEATQTMLDMSAALGQDLQSSAIQLGKALQDPVEGVTALKRVGVNFSDAQIEMIKQMVESGDTMGAQRYILSELKTEFGGMAEAMGGTFAGSIDRMKNSIGDIFETIGKPLINIAEEAMKPLIPMVQDLGQSITDYLASPEVQAAIKQIQAAIVNFVKTAIANIPAFLAKVKEAWNYLMNNKGIIVGILAAIGVSFVALGIVAINALIPIVAAALPVIAIMAAVGAAAYLLYTAWTQNWGGIQEKVQAVWTFIQPILQSLWTWLQVTIANAITFLSDTWTNVLKPAIEAVWNWMSTVVFPFWQSVANLFSAIVGKALEASAGLWQNVLQPAIEKVWNFLYTTFNPVIQKLADLFNQTLGPAIQTVKEGVLDKLAGVFDGISKAIQGVTGWINDLATKIANLKLPSWLTPGSPTPLELGLVGIGSAMKSVSQGAIPDFAKGLAMSGATQTTFSRTENKRNFYGPVQIFGSNPNDILPQLRMI